MIGQDHIRRITQVLTGGSVTAVNDVDAARAGQVAAGLAELVAQAGELLLATEQRDAGLEPVVVGDDIVCGCHQILQSLNRSV
jgi:myo-inositol 2-dehydrogenase/D-chiro-inositol 1-dehydrogenase